MKIAIIGTGYVGLVTGISLSKLGHSVICIDNNKKKLSLIKSGKSSFYEPDINNYLKKVIDSRLFNTTENLEEAVLASDITIITVGTPTVNNKIDLSAVKKASEQIGKALRKVKKYHIVVVKSTVLPGVTEEVTKPIIEKYSGKLAGEFGLCANPEFLREGSALEDAINPDRIIIGQFDKKSGQKFAEVYKNVDAPKIFTNLATAEMIKYTANALFATLISFSNEIGRISETTGKIDVVDVWKGVHLDKRLSPYNGKTRIRPGVLDYLLSGCGFGGSCLPKDIKALASFAKKRRVKAELIESVININRNQPHRLVLLLKSALGENLKSKKIAVLGLSFKPNSDDTRESPALPIIKELISEKARVIAHDPKAYKETVPKELANLSIVLTTTVQEAIKNADAAIIATSWKDYSKLKAQFFKKHMKNPVIIDGRRIYDKNAFIATGIIYKGVGL